MRERLRTRLQQNESLSESAAELWRKARRVTKCIVYMRATGCKWRGEHREGDGSRARMQNASEARRAAAAAAAAAAAVTVASTSAAATATVAIGVAASIALLSPKAVEKNLRTALAYPRLQLVRIHGWSGLQHSLIQGLQKVRHVVWSPARPTRVGMCGEGADGGRRAGEERRHGAELRLI